MMKLHSPLLDFPRILPISDAFIRRFPFVFFAECKGWCDVCGRLNLLAGMVSPSFLKGLTQLP